LDTVKAAIAAKEKVIRTLLDQLADDAFSEETRKELKTRLNTRVEEKPQLLAQRDLG